ncbi:putative bifunctional diguanylate cyclase/phosphodiesterase [Zobellella iuensis]|uniref:EAL domain-containing protein n=1 Tax=Zobellella iuensis TaxID=2803811 RepID=A0ABS1QTH7_9GAMM|nr:bifunctional diguanylate cyclase/phosphodiesterase [Zobellella iuensis]MBL1377549.1 EAL domain-containing protein [Zobellella iuensis]
MNLNHSPPVAGQALAGQPCFRTLLNRLDGLIYRAGLSGAASFVSTGSVALCGYHAGWLERQEHGLHRALVVEEDWPRVQRTLMRARDEQGYYALEYRLRCCDGRQKWVKDSGRALPLGGGGVVFEGMLSDVHEQVQDRHRLARAEARYQGLFDNSVIGMFQSTPDGHYLAANQALAEMYGYDSTDALMAGVQDIGNRLYVSPGRRDEFKQQIRERGFVSDFESEVYRQDGSTLWIAETAHAVHDLDGELLYYQGTVEDITERKRYQQRLEYQANYDLLTGLPNRHLLETRLAQSKAALLPGRGQVALAFVDLDNFKVINDSLGHAAGDRLLIEIARRLEAALCPEDTVARYGGDEFVLLLRHQGEPAGLHQALERVLAEVSAPLLLDGHELLVTCSIGVALLAVDGDNLETLLQHADAAMYSAKSRGRSGLCFYNRLLNSAAVERLRLEAALRRALERGEIDVHFQPKVDRAGRPLSFEALVRWHSPEFGAISPAVFIPIAEDTGQIEPITEFVLARACRLACTWPHELAVAVNLSPRLFYSGELCRRVERALATSGLAPHRLELELTEGILMEKNMKAVEQLQALKALGVRLAVDDFGTGYSSLAYLRRFPLDILKVDKSFVGNSTPDSSDAILVRAITSLGRELGLTVVAEGVETRAQWDFLRQAGCDEFQGYLFARPLPAEQTLEWLKQYPDSGYQAPHALPRALA